MFLPQQLELVKAMAGDGKEKISAKVCKDEAPKKSAGRPQ